MNAVTIRLPEKLAKDLDQAVKQERSTRSNLLREALEAYLRRRREAAELEKYKEAARHINQDEARMLAEEDFIPGNEVWFSGEPTPKAWPKKKRGQH
jgi:metal-responsive CopG/Arc/MetJ family transcriptional regulator